MTEAEAGNAAHGKPAGRASAWRCWCRASTRRPPSPGSSRDFRAALPQATVYVYDNNSTDGTADAARAAGAVVRRETHQGKGNVVRRMFADIDADVYVLVDGDATYDAPSAPAMIARLLEERLDMVVAARVACTTMPPTGAAIVTGNRLLTGFVATVFGAAFTDILSGYRVFSRRFVKSFPVLSGGFEIETELTVHALELELPVAEIRTPYYARPRRIGIQALDLARRLPHPRAPSSSSIARNGRCGSFRASASRWPSCRSASRSRSSCTSSSTGPCRGCRPRSWRWA